MDLKRIADVLDARVAHGGPGWEAIGIGTVFASDLMSDVLMSDRDHMLLLTSLSTEQAVRSAGIVGAEAVVVANNKTVSDPMVRLAAELGVALLCTRFPKYECSVRIGRILEPQ